VSWTYRGYRLYGMPPSSSGGTTVGETMNILENFDQSGDRTTALYRYLEALKLAYADRGKYLGDPDFVDVPLQCLLSQPFADTRASLITANALPAPQDPGQCNAEGSKSSAEEGPSTTHLTVADARGNVVSYTFTIEQIGGSAIVVPGRGFLLNNELTDFETAPGLANSPAAGKRPRSSMSPTIVTRDGKPVVALGSPGGATIITTVLQVLLNRFERGMSLPDAVAAPRASQRNGATTQAEPAFISAPETAELEARGHTFASTAEIGAVAAIEFLDEGIQQAVAEPTRRGGGSAMVAGRKGADKARHDRRGEHRRGERAGERR
jgi:gamma-glutamyltranspeptidase/glutathione hydrolase